MKLILTLVFTIAVIIQIHAQEQKLIVQFRDKATTRFSVSNPSQYLSQRAIQRRSRFRISVDSLDLPISGSYLDSLKLAGSVTIFSTSRWLNQVLIQTNDPNALKKIQSFSFVRSVKNTGYRRATNSRIDKWPDTTSNLELKDGHRSVANTADVYDYGNSYPQVHLHEGEYLHNKGFRGENMQIAVLDAGFLQYKTITAFDSIRINRQVLGERDFVAFDNSVNEDNSHGMYCLSILSANWPGKMIGTAPKAGYWLIRTENAASEYPIEEHNWLVGAEFADSAGADLITTSLGYTTFDDPAFDHSYNDLYKNSTMVSQGATIAVRKGMILTVSAGNEGAGSWKYISFPADTDSACTVGAVNNTGTIAGFSSNGYPGKVKPNIVSVGVGTVIAGLDNKPTTGNGTSFSNPNVAGLIACLWQAFPTVTNAKILDAVYKSSSRYSSPDDRYGFGIPNFRTAYLSLKREENRSLFGNEWIFATPALFNSELAVKFIGQVDGPVTISLLNAGGQVVANQNLISEKEEVFSHTFSDLNNLPSGLYSVRYSDGTIARSIQVQKGNIFEREWLVALPNPFSNDITIYIKGQETAEVTLRLIDTRGSIVKVLTSQINQNETTTIRFTDVQKLPAGVYFLQYIGRTQKRTLRLFKGQ